MLGKKIEAEREDREIPPIDGSPLVIGQDTPRLIHEFLLARSNDPRIPQRIAHLHGMYKNPTSIILSINDYIKAYGLQVAEDRKQVNQKEVWTLHRKLLWAVLATRRVVFVGFSMEDPYFNKMLEIVSADLWGWNKSIHFAVMGIPPEDAEAAKDSKDKAKRLKNNYGVETVFYKVFKDSHQRLEDLFTEIAGQCESRSQSNEETEDLLSDSDRSESAEPRSVANRSRNILNWIKRESQRMIGRVGDED